VRGNAIDSTSRTDIGAIADLTEELGFQTSNSLRATMPLYTFGKIAVARDLASVGFEVAVLERRKAELELVFDVQRAYYSYQLALALQELIDEASARLEEVRESLETRLDTGDRGARTELRQLTIYEADMAGRVADHRLLLNLALAGLRYYCGLEGAFEVTPFDDDLPETRLGDLDRFLELAREHRPDLALLDFGVEARELQADFAWRQIVPNLFVAVGFNFNYNPLADNQPSPFAYDPYNSSGIGFVVGVDWRMDFRQIAQARRADAEADRMSAQRRQAVGGIEIEVEQAFYEALGQEDRAVAEYEAFRAARAWFRQKMIQFDSGLADFDDLRDPLVAYFSAWGNYYQVLYEMRLAQANLALKVGLEGLEVGTGLVEVDDDE
jgi:outer membrane protein TolC